MVEKQKSREWEMGVRGMLGCFACWLEERKGFVVVVAYRAQVDWRVPLREEGGLPLQGFQTPPRLKSFLLVSSLALEESMKG